MNLNPRMRVVAVLLYVFTSKVVGFFCAGGYRVNFGLTTDVVEIAVGINK